VLLPVYIPAMNQAIVVIIVATKIMQAFIVFRTKNAVIEHILFCFPAQIPTAPPTITKNPHQIPIDQDSVQGSTRIYLQLQSVKNKYV